MKEGEMTEAEALEKVKRNGGELRYVLEELRTEELCWTAVKDDGRALVNTCSSS
jgi:hypothetical protein